jgi:hypothetical protein
LLCPSPESDGITGESDGVLLQPYTEINSALTPVLDLTAGVRYVTYTYNQTNAFEPRVSISIKPNSTSGLNAAYSLISQLQLPQTYFAFGNQDLGFTRSHHVDLGYWQRLSESLKLRTGIYYQYLFDVPIEQDPNSTFSALNLMDEIPPPELVNDGSGENYGVDVTLEKYFYTSTYMLVGGSYYESKYTAADGVERNTRFNGNYTFNAVYGREWIKPARNRTIGLNARILYLGGLRESMVDVPASRAESQTVYDGSDPFSNKLQDYFRLDLRLSFRKNKPGYTRTFAIDVQNLSGQQNEAYHYYDMTREKVVTKYQLGIIPILVYRIDF